MRINKIENNKFFGIDLTDGRYSMIEKVKKNKEKLKLNRPELNLII
jgi:hypothetical protein